MPKSLAVLRIALLAAFFAAGLAGGQAAEGARAEGTPSPGATAPPPAPSYEETVTVREAEVVVQVPEGLSESRRRALAPASLLVFENGVYREVTAVEALEGREGEWTVVVAFDRALVARDTLFRGAVALGQRAERLARLGSVEIVETGSPSRHWLAPSRDATAIAQACADIAASTRPDGRSEGRAEGPAGSGSSASVTPAIDAVREGARRLLSTLAEQAPGGPNALVWLADLEAPPSSAAVAAARDVAAFNEIAQAVAAYGWTALAVGLQPPAELANERRASEFDRLRQLGLGGTTNHSFAVDVGKRSELDKPGALNVFVQPASGLVRALARETAGTLVGVESQLDAALDDLERRLIVVYRTPAAVDGALRSLEVRLLPDDLPCRVVHWQRAGTPEVVAEGRLVEVATGSRPRHGLEVTATLLDEPRGRFLRIAVADPPGALPAGEDGSGSGPVRISWSVDGRAAHHRVVARAIASGWTEEIPLAGAGAGAPWALVVEDLGRGRWAGLGGSLATP